MLSNSKGQSTLEYIAIFVAVVAAIAYFAYTKVSPSVEKIMDASANKITDSATNFSSTK